MSQTPNMNQKQSLTNKPSRNNNQTYNNTTILTTHYIPPITTHYQATTTPPYQPIHNEPDSEPNLNNTRRNNGDYPTSHQDSPESSNANQYQHPSFSFYPE
jgi:hypothetical protein